jgi:hypothetical protein
LGTFTLGIWVNFQRNKQEIMPPERRRHLDDIGFIWRAKVARTSIIGQSEANFIMSRCRAIPLTPSQGELLAAAQASAPAAAGRYGR